jgi:hypothetical protein
MKKTILSALLLASVSIFAIEPPKFLEGFNYKIETAITEEGEEFEYFVIEDGEYNDFKKSVVQYRKRGFDLEKNGLLWVYRKIDGWDVMSARGFDFKRFVIVQE